MNFIQMFSSVTLTIIFIDNLVENVCDELTLAHSSISVSEEYYIIPADLYRIKILYKTENNNLIS